MVEVELGQRADLDAGTYDLDDLDQPLPAAREPLRRTLVYHRM